MQYLNANIILPDYLIEELQKYVQGEYVYIPIKKEKHKKWGERSGSRDEIKTRNMEILERYKQGLSIYELSDIYHLSIHSIRKIIYKK